ncbi:DUF3302 domain-containing protein [Cerasicoccus arenae]|uniref:DUF3302 domain-containing protein n=1 Tax=Cerasicoccus arenae TaxID=424488 RepID=A0A8J3GEK6_9BACT|nr:DUF3302 domain-containing protein [Cerasicoccus arenae]MBK1858792.1 DUF3302 domain-containing protein [Cerasicoccus arenae]GHC04554.1 hypothetical protein GCM10007047_21720 [Cerasicoccus arenae]
MSKLDIISLCLIFFAVLTIVLGIVKIHCYPGTIAKQRNHPQAKAIEVTSLLGLIAFPLWMFALIWAYSNAVIGKVYREDGPEVETPPKPLPEFLEKHRKHPHQSAAKEKSSAARKKSESDNKPAK